MVPRARLGPEWNAPAEEQGQHGELDLVEQPLGEEETGRLGSATTHTPPGASPRKRSTRPAASLPSQAKAGAGADAGSGELVRIAAGFAP